MFNLNRLLAARRKLEHHWSDTEVAPPDTVILVDDDRLAAAESEWLMDELLVTHAGAALQNS
jgi:hypothetical protein